MIPPSMAVAVALPAESPPAVRSVATATLGPASSRASLDDSSSPIGAMVSFRLSFVGAGAPHPAIPWASAIAVKDDLLIFLLHVVMHRRQAIERSVRSVRLRTVAFPAGRQTNLRSPGLMLMQVVLRLALLSPPTVTSAGTIAFSHSYQSPAPRRAGEPDLKCELPTTSRRGESSREFQPDRTAGHGGRS